LTAGTHIPFARSLAAMRCVWIIEGPNETYPFAAIDQATGEFPLQLAPRLIYRQSSIFESLGSLAIRKPQTGAFAGNGKARARAPYGPELRFFVIFGGALVTIAGKCLRNSTSSFSRASRRPLKYLLLGSSSGKAA
jgi:hypothetical protein